MSRNDGARLFHVAGPATEKARSLNFVFVRTVAAPLVTEDRIRHLLESAATNWTRSLR